MPYSTVISGAYSFATDQISGVEYPREKIAWGVEGTATEVTLTSAFPVQPGTGTTWAVTQSGSWTVAVSGTVPISAASLPLPTGAATAANQATEITSLASIDTKTPALGQALAAGSVPVVLTASQLSTLTPLSTVAVTQSTSPWVVSLSSTTITGTVAVTQSTSPWVVSLASTTITGTVTVDTELPAAALLADNTANPTVPGVGAFGMIWDGSNWDRLPGNSSDGVTVNLGSNNDVTVTGTVAVTQSGTWNIGTVTTVSTITNVVHVDDNGGSLTVDGTVAATQSGSWTVAVSGTVTVTDASIITDDAAFTPGTSKITMIGAEFDDNTPDSVDEGDGGAIRMSQNRCLYVVVRDVDGNERGLKVDGNGAIAVAQMGTWTVTAEAGTNLNTSALALESGGNLAAAATSLGVIDDWDESDRSKVNVIVGQAGVAGGAGAVGATTQRVTLASDDPAVVAVQLLDDAVKTDDAAFTPGTDKVLMIGAQCDATTPDSVDEGDSGALRMTADRALHISIRDTAGNNRGANVNASNELLVTATQSGTWTVTANAGTNLNTSALALESGGNLAGAATSLAVIDDWDESDRAKVNLIVGQAGVAANTGTVGATTQRVVLPSDERIVGVEAQATITGLTTYFSNAATATATAIKAAAGNLYCLEASNPNTTDCFLQVFDLATGSVTLGTTTPKQSFLVPAGSSSTVRGAFDRVWTVPVTFSTAITYAVTTTPTGSTAPGSNCTVNAEYK